MNNAGGKQRVVPAIMPDSFEALGELSGSVASFSSAVQLDVMDGDFAETVSWPYANSLEWNGFEKMAASGEPLPKSGVLKYEVHLMVSDPARAGELFARVGAKCIVGHIEAFESESEVRAALSSWRASGAAYVGLSLLIETDLSRVESFVEDGTADFIQIMSIPEIGRQGNVFDSRAIDRVKEIRGAHPRLTLSADGGVSEKNVRELFEAGLSYAVVGSAIMASADTQASYRRLEGLAASAFGG